MGSFGVDSEPVLRCSGQAWIQDDRRLLAVILRRRSVCWLVGSTVDRVMFCSLFRSFTIG